jgi:hypothetical protein
MENMRKKMKKKLGVLSLLISGLFILSPEISNAADIETIETMDYKTLAIDEDLTIKKYSDGRIEGISNPASLNEEQKEEFLNSMLFTDEEIEKMPEEMKDEIIAEGGVKVDIEEEEMLEKYQDLNGVVHEVTDENRDEINALKEADLKKINADKIGTMSMGTVKDGAFNGASALVYIGKTANAKEFKYSFKTTYLWTSAPVNAFWDTISQAYAGNTTPVGSNGKMEWLDTHNRLNSENIKVDQLSLNGSTAKVALQPYSNRQNGYIATEVRIPVSEAGKTGVFANGYAHAYTPVPFGVTIGNLSFNFTGVGPSYSWRSSFIIGKSS